MDPNRPKDVQLTITQAIDIARGIPERAAALRIQVAHETVERSLGVVETRTLIERVGGVQGYRLGGALRKPSEDYRTFVLFLARTRRDAERMNGKLDFDDMYEHRVTEDVDRRNDVATVDAIIKTLEKVKEKIIAS